jgi:hypothetical protein
MKVLQAVVRSHRLLLILSTVGLGVAGSRVAADFQDLVWVCLLLGFAALLWLADACQQMDDRARELARSTNVPIQQTVADYLRGAGKWRVAAPLIVGVLCLGASVWFAIS